jgi:hypothetical protein
MMDYEINGRSIFWDTHKLKMVSSGLKRSETFDFSKLDF